ncbi:GNAT family N-acetyltransferase [Chryseobacterium daeguense]|uniref:GNAT family N-acetyltransferase n=1 Tax=Chryseobacterium daeguense TaxID=412438 RepID=UPI0004067B92|nr:GNAT family N-acetyltransferase [Chryseobacterium daeguense]
MGKEISPDIIETWLKAWSLSRELPPPVRYESGFMVDVGYEKQKKRYVFPKVNDDFLQLTRTINEPWVFLKVCGSFNEFKADLSENWILQPQGYMMFCFKPMIFPDIMLPDEYILRFHQYGSTFVVSIVTKDSGEVASEGRVIIANNLAVYDRISTAAIHRRKRLATFLIKELEKIALSKNVSNNFLVATEEGRLLYESLGWELYSPYTSIVISGD